MLESACLLSRAFYLQVLFLLFVCAWVLLPAHLWLCFNAYFIACFCFDCLFMYVFVLCIMYCISFLRYRAETRNVYNFYSIFRSCDLDFCPTNLNINRLPPLIIRHVCTKFHLDPTFRSYQIFVLFLEVVTLTFVLQTSISIGFLLSLSGMCVPSFI